MFIEAKDDGSGGDNWSCKTCKAPVVQIIITSQCYFSYGFSVSVTVVIFQLQLVIVFQFLFLFQLAILHKICISAYH